MSCALSGSGCGGRTAVGIFELGGAGFDSSGGASVTSAGTGASASGAFSGGSPNGGDGPVFDAGPNGGASHAGGSQGGATSNAGAGTGEAGSDAGAAGASGAPGGGCDPNAGLVQGPGGCVAVVAPRLIAPLSTSTVTSRRPSLHSALAGGTDGVHIEICLDRACQSVLTAFDGSASLATPPADLQPGVLFWRAFGKSGAVTGKVASATWQFIVPRRSAPTDTSWGTTLDVNGDGFADVFVGAPMVGSNSPFTPAGTGRAYLFLGSKAGLNGTPATSLTGPDGAKGQFGSVAGSAGDVNGDGYADVIVGAPGASTNLGRAYVYLGSAAGLGTIPQSLLVGATTGPASFGASVASAGDLNGDGYGDVIVGAPLTRGEGSLNSFMGRAYVFLGSASGIVNTPVVTLRGWEAAGSKYGGLVASAGDVNADGFADLVVSDRPYVQVSANGYQAAPAFYAYLGGAAGPATTPAFDLENQNWMGSTVASGCDLNGDGHADLAVGTMGSTSAAIYLGNDSGVGAGSASTLGPQYGSGGYTYTLTCGGDINGDGYQDLLASFDQIFVYSGAATGLVDSPAIITPPVTAFGPTVYGFRITQVVDIDRDGYDDVVVGARFDNNFVGRALVYMGSAAGLSALPSLILPGTDGPGGELG